MTGGYAFARFSFPGKNVLFLTTLAILMVPYATLLIPLYLLHNFARTVPIIDQVARLDLVWLALVLGVFQLPFATFMMRISFESVPRELEEAALVDGAGTFGVFRHILLPAVRPGIVTVGLFAFLAAWNDFFAPLILINAPEEQPLPLALVNLRQQTMGAVDFGSTEAGVVVLAIPCLVLFLLLQRTTSRASCREPSRVDAASRRPGQASRRLKAATISESPRPDTPVLPEMAPAGSRSRARSRGRRRDDRTRGTDGRPRAGSPV